MLIAITKKKQGERLSNCQTSLIRIVKNFIAQLPIIFKHEDKNIWNKEFWFEKSVEKKMLRYALSRQLMIKTVA